MPMICFFICFLLFFICLNLHNNLLDNTRKDNESASQIVAVRVLIVLKWWNLLFDDVNLTEIYCNSFFFRTVLNVFHFWNFDQSRSESKECCGQLCIPPRSSIIFYLDRNENGWQKWLAPFYSSQHWSQLKKFTTKAYRIHFNWLFKVDICRWSVETKFVWFRSLYFMSGKQLNSI